MKLGLLPFVLILLLASNLTLAGAKKPAVSNIYSGVSFHYLDQEDRVDIITSFLKRVQMEYVLLPLKEKRLGINLSKMREEAIQLEKSITDTLLSADLKTNLEARERVSQIQAKMNQDFFDRMLKLVAIFKDTHFGIRTKIARPSVYFGINFYRADGKVTVGSIDKKLLALSSKVSGANFSEIVPGQEVEAIDGIPVEDKINELKPYINASSDGYADMIAIWSLSGRNFKYPEKNFVILKLANGSTYKLPYFANASKDATPRIDANVYFNKIGIPSDATSVSLVFDSNTNTWKDDFSTFTGYRTQNLFLNLNDLKIYNDDNGNPAIRTGYYIKKGIAHGVLQLLTFHTKNVKRGEEVTPFIQAIANFINELKDNDIDLIIDLRNNGGGSIAYTSQLLSLIAPQNANYPGQTAGYRIVPSIREIIEADLSQVLPAEDLSYGITMDEIKNIFYSTIDENRSYTPMFTYSSVTASPLVKGYDKKVVALISPNCISACDITAFILKASGRATLIGSHSNGTGAGFLENDVVTNLWEDDTKVFETKIPNLLFGLPGSATDTSTLIFEKDSVDRLDTENRPTYADVEYTNTLTDIWKQNIGWLEKAAEVLESK